MIRNDESSILYIEPKNPPAAEPVIDDITRKMAGAYNFCVRGPAWRGFHTCSCGAKSDNCEHILPGGVETNSLCVHYLAYHRDEVPEAELLKVCKIVAAPADPLRSQLAPPPAHAIEKARALTIALTRC